MTRSHLGIAAWLVLAVVLMGAAVGPQRVEILRPRLGIPAVLAPGESVTVQFRTGWPTSSIPEVTLANAGGLIKLPTGTLEGQFPFYSLQVPIPMETPEGRYGFSLELPGCVSTMVASVFLRQPLGGDMLLVQLADLPLIADNGKGAGDEMLRDMIKEINLINPDVVLLSGDVAYNGSEQGFQVLFDHLKEIRAPIVCGMGNHELDGLATYQKLFGAPNHVVDIGSWRILSIYSGHGRDQLSESQYAWVKESFQDRSRTTLVQTHHPLFWRRNLEIHQDDLANLCLAAKVPIAFSGHWHGDCTFDSTGKMRLDSVGFPGTKFTVTTAAGADLRPGYSFTPAHHGYRIARFRGGQLMNYTYDLDGDGERDPACSMPVGLLKQRQIAPGVVEVRNDSNEDFFGVCVELFGSSPGGVAYGDLPKRSRRIFREMELACDD